MLRRRRVLLTWSPPEEFDEAIAAWKESIQYQPSSPDTHTSMYPLFVVSSPYEFNWPLLDLASAYIISPGISSLWRFRRYDTDFYSI